MYQNLDSKFRLALNLYIFFLSNNKYKMSKISNHQQTVFCEYFEKEISVILLISVKITSKFLEKLFTSKKIIILIKIKHEDSQILI